MLHIMYVIHNIYMIHHMYSCHVKRLCKRKRKMETNRQTGTHSSDKSAKAPKNYTVRLLIYLSKNGNLHVSLSTTVFQNGEITARAILQGICNHIIAM